MKLLKENKIEPTYPKDVENSLNKICGKATQNLFNKNMSFDELLDLSTTLDSIIVQINGENKSSINNSFIQERDEINVFTVKEKPIETFASLPRYNVVIKCFTYFSALKEYWNSFRIDLMDFTFVILHELAQYHPVNKYMIAVHSTNILQRVSEMDYFDVRPNDRFTVKYFGLNLELLLESSESNCAHYDIRNEEGKIRMESEFDK